MRCNTLVIVPEAAFASQRALLEVGKAPGRRRPPMCLGLRRGQAGRRRRQGTPMMTSSELSIWIGAAMGVKLQPQPAGQAHGGSINTCYRWESDVGSLFVKVAAAERRAMLEAEAVGLEELRRAAAVRVPRV